MAENRQKTAEPAVLFGQKSIKRVGYIDEYIFACEIDGKDHIIYSSPRKPRYHLVIIILEGSIDLIINGQAMHFEKHTYINLPTWAEIHEIDYKNGLHAMATATDRNVVEDIFRNRNPFPPDFRFTIDHGFGGYRIDRKTIDVLCRDISNMITSLGNKEHHFAEEVNYAYFYILLTDMADMMWNRYGSGTPSHKIDMKRSDSIVKEFAALLGTHIMTETSVGFYAEKLCISKKYLSQIIKDKTRVSVGTIIAVMRTEVAARLLRDPEKSIQQIAAQMSFSDQSAFGKFFRKRTGMSPMKYRKSLRKTLLTMRPTEARYSADEGLTDAIGPDSLRNA